MQYNRENLDNIATKTLISHKAIHNEEMTYEYTLNSKQYNDNIQTGHLKTLKISKTFIATVFHYNIK